MGSVRPILIQYKGLLLRHSLRLHRERLFPQDLNLPTAFHGQYHTFSNTLLIDHGVLLAFLQLKAHYVGIFHLIIFTQFKNEFADKFQRQI